MRNSEEDADLVDMDSVFANLAKVPAGTGFALVYYTDGFPHFLTTKVVSSHPFILEADQNVSGRLAVGQKVLIVHQNETDFSKANAEIATAQNNRVTLSNVNWDNIDRRRYPRHEVAIHVSIRSIVDDVTGTRFQTFEGVTTDLSLGGTWVDSPAPVAAGSLVQIEADLSSQEKIRLLGIVAWANQNRPGFGIEFLDFVGGARYYLHEFLSRAAA